MGAPELGSCFHCGEAVPPGSRYSAVIDGTARSMCCVGCAAVARTIAEHGLAAYYANRGGRAVRDYATASVEIQDFSAYDLAAIQKPFVRELSGGIRQATLLVEGISCGACAWLIENALQRVTGVRSVAVNVTAARTQVEWDNARTSLSALLRAIAALGYATQGFDPTASERAAARENRAFLWRLFVAGFAMMQIMMYALPAYVTEGELSHDVERLMQWASLALTVPVMVWSAGPFFRGAWRDLRAYRAGMDVPVALGLAVAFAASAWATVSGRGAVYFDSIAMFVFLLLGARWLEAAARARAMESQRRLIGHQPAVAERLVTGGAPGATERVAVAQLTPGDLVQVAVGVIVPADGRVTAGRSMVDESLITGESWPVGKGPGAAVTGGSLNVGEPMTVEVTHVGADTVLAGIVRLMDRAQAEKPRIAQLADRVAQWFVAVLTAIGMATGVVWWWVDPSRAAEVMVAVLVVSCPCALSLATPAALAAATDALHRIGILVTRGHALETLSRVTHVVFDKTGTLTSGELRLIGVRPLGARNAEECLALAAALERGSEHPIARAICAARKGFTAAFCTEPTQEARHHAGLGVEGSLAGVMMRIGSPVFAAELAGRPLPRELDLTADEVMVALLADENGYLALFTFDNPMRTGARGLVQELTARGKTVCLLSGDRQSAVSHLARQLGIGTAVAHATPEAKLAYVRELQAQGGVVAMVGDGVNDAPVLARAQVSIAMGKGADLAHAGADMVLLGEDVARLGSAFDTARQARSIIRQNLAWAAAYNVVAVPLAMTGFITPLSAGVGMALSSLAVVLNALRLAPRTGNRSSTSVGVQWRLRCS